MKIGLIAVSGIRVCDGDLLRLGLTLPGFVERSKTIASLPSLGLLTLAGMTPDRHEIEYIEMPDPAAADPLPAGLDLVAISSYSAQIFEAYELADRFREAGVPVVMGGPHVSALPSEAAAHCDAVVNGEGEPVWNRLLADAEAGTLNATYGPDPDGHDMADSPVPAFQLLDVSQYNRITVQTSRGCPHRCEFCASSVLLTDRYKQKPADKVAAEIDRILECWEHPFIEFADDNSVVDPAYWRELLPMLKQRHIRWFTETDIAVAEHDDVLNGMRDSGCAQVLIGLESPVEAGLGGVEQRNDWKHRRWPDYREAIRNIQSHGITVNGCFVIGLDGHTPEIFDQVAAFVEDSGLYEVQVTVLTAFPGTPLYTRLKDEGRILEDERWDKCSLFDLNFQPKGMTADELTDGFRRLVVDLYNEENTRRRRDGFKEQLRKKKDKEDR